MDGASVFMPQLTERSNRNSNAGSGASTTHQTPVPNPSAVDAAELIVTQAPQCPAQQNDHFHHIRVRAQGLDPLQELVDWLVRLHHVVGIGPLAHADKPLLFTRLILLGNSTCDTARLSE